MYQHSKGKPGFLQQLVRLGNLGECASENVRIAVQRFLEGMVQVNWWWPHFFRR